MFGKKNLTAISIFFLLGQAHPACVRADSKQPINAHEAVEIAERFIRENGYTAKPAMVEHLAPESLNFGLSKEQALSIRHDSLEPHAYGVLKGALYYKEHGWTVVFRSNIARLGKPSNNNSGPVPSALGRAVLMDEFGNGVLVEHKDIKLSSVEPDEQLSKDSPATADCNDANLVVKSQQKQDLKNLVGKKITLKGHWTTGKQGPGIQLNDGEEPIYFISRNSQHFALEWHEAEINVVGTLRYCTGPSESERERNKESLVDMPPPYFFFNESDSKLERNVNNSDDVLTVIAEYDLIPGTKIPYLRDAYEGKPIFLVDFDTTEEKNLLSGLSPGAKLRATGKLHFWSHDFSQWQPLVKLPFKPHHYFDMSETTIEKVP